MKLNEYKTFDQCQVIYGIQNIITGKWYIGSCDNLYLRIRRHYYYLKHNTHHSKKLQNAWNKYGEDNFTVEILEKTNIERDQLLKLEETYITKYNSFEDGYNMIDKCFNYIHYKLTDQQKQKFANSRKKQVVAIDRFTGKIIKQFDSVISAAQYFNEQSTNISSVCKHKLRYVKDTVFVYLNEYDENKDYKVLNHHYKGIKFSEEHKRKMRENSKNSLLTYKFSENGELIQTYFSMAEAERQNGFSKEYLKSNLDKLMNGFIYTHNKNYKKDIV